jgi:hypothetical protein
MKIENGRLEQQILKFDQMDCFDCNVVEVVVFPEKARGLHL